MSNNPASGGGGDTIISIPQLTTLQPLVHEPAASADGGDIQEARFKVRLANTEGRRSTASYLIERRYAWRGYQVSQAANAAPNLITLAAYHNDEPVATITVGTDSPRGLVVEALYPDEVASLRAPGVGLCEFTKLAVDNMVKSKAVLAAIFHIAYIHARRLRQSTDLLIEVNPRHVKFYKALLGFTVVGEERMDPRVGAPAVLLRLDLAYAESQIARWGGHRELADQTRLLYPYVFSPLEEKGIEGRLRLLE